MKKISIFLLVIMCLFMTACGKKEEVKEEKEPEEIIEPEPIIEKSKFNIIDTTSNKRPYGVVINNYPSAVKVQSGLDKAYVIYEIPIEGGLSRSIAFFKDVNEAKLGTIRSARHNYIDYMQEHDAIFVHFGGSHFAYNELNGSNKVDHIDGNTTDSKPFWREKYENLAYEHRVYTNLSNIIDYVENTKKFRTTTDNEPVLNYSQTEVKLSNREDSQIANTVDVYYSNNFYVTYKYNSETKKYDRYFKGSPHVDYFTKKQYDCKNVIITFITWGTKQGVDRAGNSYLDLNNTGTGEGYYITNGYAVPITWEKKTRSSKTIYKYMDGTEIDVNDGNTWVMLTSKSKKYNIE